MQLAVNTVPVPLPITPGGSPDTWAGKHLVQVDYQVKVGSAPTSRVVGPMTAISVGTTNDSGVVRSGGATDSRAFSKLASTTFTQAVEAASRISASHKLGEGTPQATAVLQAGDGAYYTSALTNGSNFLTVDAANGVIYHDISSLHPDVRAIVGANAWVNFTTESIQPDLAG